MNLRNQFAAASVACLTFAGVSAAQGATFMFTPYTGSSASAKLTLSQITLSGFDAVQFQVDVLPNPNIGDLQGVFFNVSNESLLGSLVISGTDVTGSAQSANAVSNLGGGNNSNPEGPFDAGVTIGTPGIGSDDIQSTLFTVSKAGTNLPLNLFTTATDPVDASGPNALLFAIRMTSVGLPGGDRTGSSKLGSIEEFVEQETQSDVPEPGTVALFASLGITGAGILLRRRRAR